jgi:23S rRNA (guanosine2251-2'-O)-methyltransferase
MAAHHGIGKRNRHGGTKRPGAKDARARSDRPVSDRPVAGRPIAGRPVAGRPISDPSVAGRPVPAMRPRREAPSAPPADREAPRRDPLPRFGGDWLYGRHAVAAALANPARRVRHLVASEEAADYAAVLVATARARLPEAAQPQILARDALDALLPEGAVHQGIALAAPPLPSLAIEDVIERAGPAPRDGEAPQLVLLLDQVSDPHNIGAVLRSAAAFGALALVLPEHGAPPITGVLAKAASGAVEHVPIVRVVNLARTMDRLKEAGFWCLGLDEAAGRTLPALSLGGRLALVLGAEGEGMRRLTRERCDLIARLPTAAAFGSLNVSNAAAIALYELNRAAALAGPAATTG